MTQNESENIWEIETSEIAFRTEPIPEPFHKIIHKTITTRQDMWWRGSLRGSNVDSERW